MDGRDAIDRSAETGSWRATARPTARLAAARLLALAMVVASVMAWALSACGGPPASPTPDPVPDPDPTPAERVVRYALVASLAVTDQSIASYAVTEAGRWAFVDAAPLPSFARGVVVHPDAPRAYVVTSTGLGVPSLTRVDLGADGRFAAPVPLGLEAPQQPRAPVLHPNGTTIYVPGGDGSVWQYALAADGALQALSPPSVASPVTGAAINAFAIHPSGVFAYATHPSDDVVVAFSIGGDGALTPLAAPHLTVAAGAAPYGIAVSPLGDAVYVTLPVADAVLHASVGEDGRLTPVGTVATPAGSQPAAIAVDADGAHGYVAFATSEGGAMGFAIGADGSWIAHGDEVAQTGPLPLRLVVDPAGTAVHVVPQGDAGVYHLSIGSDGRLSATRRWPSPTRGVPIGVAFVEGDAHAEVEGAFAYAAAPSVAAIAGVDLTGAVPDALPSSPIPAWGLASHPSGRWLYASGGSTITSHNVGVHGGLAQTIPPGVDLGVEAVFPTVDPVGRFLYVPAWNDDLIAVARIAHDGTLTVVDPIVVDPDTNPVTLRFHPSGRFAYVTSVGFDRVLQFGVTIEGVLTPLDPPYVPTAAAPFDLAVHPDGRSLHVGGSALTRFVIADDGRLEPASPPTIASFGNVWALVIDPLGRSLHYALFDAFDAHVFGAAIGSDGLVADVDTPRLAFEATALAYDPSGRRLYAASPDEPTFLGLDLQGDGRVVTDTAPAFAFDLPAIAITIAVVPRWR